MDEKPEYVQQAQLGLECMKNVRDKVEVKVYNQYFVINPNVFNPKSIDYIRGVDFYAEELIKIISEFRPKQPKVLEIGTGAGYMGILAVLNGASHATCTDINRDALKNAEENVTKYNVKDRITLKYSDVFDALNSDDKFDMIHWNVPFTHINKPVEELEILARALFDPFHKSLDTYLKDANEYLNQDGGRVFINHSISCGDQQIFENIAKKYNWNIHLRNEIKLDNIPAYQVGFYEFTQAQ